MRKKIALVVIVSAPVLGLYLYVSGGGGALPKAAGQAQAAEIVLYTGENFTGRAIRVLGTVYDLPLEEDLDGSFFNWNDQIRSLVVVSGTWRIWQHGRGNTRLDDTAIEVFDVRTKLPAEGWSALVSATSAGPLEVSDLALVGVGEDISSLELVSESNLPDWAQSMRK